MGSGIFSLVNERLIIRETLSLDKDFVSVCSRSLVKARARVERDTFANVRGVGFGEVPSDTCDSVFEKNSWTGSALLIEVVMRVFSVSVVRISVLLIYLDSITVSFFTVFLKVALRGPPLSPSSVFVCSDWFWFSSILC